MSPRDFTFYQARRRMARDPHLPLEAAPILEQFTASGITEIDGLSHDYFHNRVSDLRDVDDGGPWPNRISRGTCPRCGLPSLVARLWLGTWCCSTCQQGGGVVAFEVWTNPETYAGEPAEDWHRAAIAVMRWAAGVLEGGEAEM